MHVQIIAVDYTKSNQWMGKHTFGGKSLHYIDAEGLEPNPYMKVIEIVGKALAPFDDDNLIPVFGFGDSTTTDRAVFPFFAERPVRGFEEALARYQELTPKVIMSGPTNFSPAIETAIQIVEQTHAYHILVIIAGASTLNACCTAAWSQLRHVALLCALCMPCTLRHALQTAK